MNDCIFCKIVSREIPSTIIWETESLIAFPDINPASPTHVLLIPKKHCQDLNHADSETLTELIQAVPVLAQELKLDSYRTVINTGAGSGQTIFHLHLHLMARRSFEWPPG